MPRRKETRFKPAMEYSGFPGDAPLQVHPVEHFSELRKLLRDAGADDHLGHVLNLNSIWWEYRERADDCRRPESAAVAAAFQDLDAAFAKIEAAWSVLKSCSDTALPNEDWRAGIYPQVMLEWFRLLAPKEYRDTLEWGSTQMHHAKVENWQRLRKLQNAVALLRQSMPTERARKGERTGERELVKALAAFYTDVVRRPLGISHTGNPKAFRGFLSQFYGIKFAPGAPLPSVATLKQWLA